MQKKALFLTLAGLLLSHSAWATPAIATGETPKTRRTEIHIGMLAGGSNIGDVSGPGVGLEVNAGMRFNDLTILGQLDYLGVGESSLVVDPRRGDMARLGLAARYSVFQIDASEALAMRFWLEAGGGRQRVAWNNGGTLTRNDLVLGFGLQLDAIIGARSSKPRYLGPYFAFRANMARAPESMDDAGATPTCGGPCDTATSPSANDVSVFFNFGMHWGR